MNILRFGLYLGTVTFKWPTPTRTSSSGRSARGRVADQGMGRARERVVQYGRRRAQNPPHTAYSTEQPATVWEQPATVWEQPATVRAIRLAIRLAIGRKGSLCRRAAGRAVPMRRRIPLLPTTKSCHRSRIRPSATLGGSLPESLERQARWQQRLRLAAVRLLQNRRAHP